MTRKKLGYLTLSFLLTLLCAGLLNVVASNHNTVSNNTVSQQQASNASLHQELEKAIPRAPSKTLQQYQQQHSPPAPSEEDPPYYLNPYLRYQYRTWFASSPLLAPWFIATIFPATNRVSGWKDSNLIYQNLALQHA